MSFEPDKIDAVTFDSYSTLVDVGTTVEALDEHVQDPISVGRTWRIQSLIYAFASTAMDSYEPFWDLCEYALDYALAENDVDLPADTREEIMAVYHDLDAFDDVRPGIERLVDGGYDCYVISNGSPEMLESMLEGAAIDHLVEDTVSAHDVEAYKPDPAIYEAGVARAGTDPDRIAHATAAMLDVQGGQNVGMQGIWLNRHDRAASPFGTAPDGTVSTVTALADQLGV